MRLRHWLALIALGLAGSVLAADAEVRERDVGSDHFVFGGSVRVGKQVPGDLIAAGGNVDLDAEVKGDAVAVGARIFGGSDGRRRTVAQCIELHRPALRTCRARVSWAGAGGENENTGKAAADLRRGLRHHDVRNQGR